MRRGVVRWPLWLVDLLFPHRCVGCGIGCDGGSVLCSGCLSGLRPVPAPLCARCGAPVAWAVPRCRDCVHRRTGFVSARSAFLYTPTLRALVKAWKAQGVRSVASLAGDLACGVLETPPVDALVPVAPDPGRLLERGHHPPARLAAALARRWDLPVVECLGRSRSGPRQASLPREERRGNVRGVFVARGALPRRVALVDDVYTTGATAASAAAALRRGGAEEVHVLTFARAIR